MNRLHTAAAIAAFLMLFPGLALGQLNPPAEEPDPAPRQQTRQRPPDQARRPQPAPAKPPVQKPSPPKPAERPTVDGGSVVSVKFFEGGQSGPALAQRSYRDAFSRNNTRFIHYEVTMEFPLNATRTRTIELQCVCVASDGREIFRLTLPCKVEQGYEVGIYSLGWGREKTGGWEPGSYTVKFYFSDREVASGSFRVY